MPRTDTSADRPVHWISEGDGPVVVLLHGLGGDSAFWTAETPEWSTDFRVIALDLRGSGKTNATEGGHSMADLADDVCAVLDEAAIETAHVVGFSMGGLVAQSLAARQPGRVDRLVLASTYADMNAQARMFLDAVRDVVNDTGSMRAVFPLVCPWLFSVGFLEDPANAAWLATPDDDEEESPEGWLAQYQAQRGFHGHADLARIQSPTLVIAGEVDRLVTASDAQALAEGIPNASIRIISGSGHLVNVEEHEQFVGTIREFLLA